jgi:hypothetical protein
MIRNNLIIRSNMLLQIIGIRTIFILFFDIYKEKVKQKTKMKIPILAAGTPIVAGMGKEDLSSKSRPPVIRLYLICDCPHPFLANQRSRKLSNHLSLNLSYKNKK